MQSSNEMGPPSVGRLRLARASGTIGGGKYRVFASLGRGGMADVQLAAARGPKGFNKLVVVKRLRPLLADDPVAVNMFLDEARLDARLNHPNVVHTYEIGEESGSYFIVMEHLDGQSLHELLGALRAAGRSAPPGLWAAVVAEALAGLHYAHELTDYDGTPLHVVHRDVSPQNIVVTYDGRVKLVDFGIAKASVNVNKTESQIIKGKLAYMAPEQADPPSDRALDRRVDVFAMGIVLWECLSQKRLVTGDARAAMSKILDLDFRAPSLSNPAVPPELDAITKRALERRPEDRFPTALAMREAIERYQRARGEFFGATEIGALMGELFRTERDDLRRQIRAQMADLGDGARDLVVLPDESKRAAPPAAKKGPALAPAPLPSLVDSVGSLRAVRTHVGPPPTSASRLPRLALPLVALALAGGAVVTTLRLRSHPPAASRAADTVRVTVRAAPEDAALTLDGVSVPNPFEATVSVDAVDHKIEARRDGYVARAKSVRFDHGDTSLDLALEKAPAPAPPVSAPPAPAAAPTPSHAPPASRSKPAAGAGARTQPNLDDDPWR